MMFWRRRSFLLSCFIGSFLFVGVGLVAYSPTETASPYSVECSCFFGKLPTFTGHWALGADGFCGDTGHADAGEECFYWFTLAGGVITPIVVLASHWKPRVLGNPQRPTSPHRARERIGRGCCQSLHICSPSFWLPLTPDWGSPRQPSVFAYGWNLVARHSVIRCRYRVNLVG